MGSLCNWITRISQIYPLWKLYCSKYDYDNVVRPDIATELIDFVGVRLWNILHKILLASPLPFFVESHLSRNNLWMTAQARTQHSDQLNASNATEVFIFDSDFITLRDFVQFPQFFMNWH